MAVKTKEKLKALLENYINYKKDTSSINFLKIIVKSLQSEVLKQVDATRKIISHTSLIFLLGFFQT